MNLLVVTILTLAAATTATPGMNISHSKCHAEWLSPTILNAMIEIELNKKSMPPTDKVEIDILKCTATEAHINIHAENENQMCKLDIPVRFRKKDRDKHRTIALQVSEMVQFCKKQTSSTPKTQQLAPPVSNRIPSLSTWNDVQFHPQQKSTPPISRRLNYLPDYATFALETRRGGWFCKCGLMEHNGTSPVKKKLTKFSPEELFALADAARFDGNHKGAIIPLKALLAQYPQHTSAPKAAFTIAKIYLNSLFIPTRAAEYFEKALSMGLDEPFRETAVAETARAYYQARNPKYHKTAEAYVALYPLGQYRTKMKKIGNPQNEN